MSSAEEEYSTQPPAAPEEDTAVPADETAQVVDAAANNDDTAAENEYSVPTPLENTTADAPVADDAPAEEAVEAPQQLVQADEEAESSNVITAAAETVAETAAEPAVEETNHVAAEPEMTPAEYEPEPDTSLAASFGLSMNADKRAAAVTAEKEASYTVQNTEKAPATTITAPSKPVSSKWQSQAEPADKKSEPVVAPVTTSGAGAALAAYDGSKFSYEDLKDARPGAEGSVGNIIWTAKELYLTDAEFTKVFGMAREEYEKLAGWRQTALKKKAGLF